MGIGKKFFGEGSSNKRLSTQTKEQRALSNQYMRLLGKGAAGSIGALNEYGSKAYNPFDEARGDQVFGDLASDIELQRQREMDAVKGGPLNRFSLASGAMNTGINNSARTQLNNLSLQNLGMRTQGNQQAYGNQMSAIAQALGIGSGLTGQNSVQNQTQVDGGWLANMDRLNNNVAGATQAFGNLFGGVKGMASM